MRYTVSKYHLYVEEMVYRNYVCNSIQTIHKHESIVQTYNDIIHPKPKIEAEEVVEDIIKGAGLIIKG